MVKLNIPDKKRPHLVSFRVDTNTFDILNAIAFENECSLGAVARHIIGQALNDVKHKSSALSSPN